MMTKGFLYPIGTRVRLKGSDKELLIVDMDPRRRDVIAAWKDGNAVSEARFFVDQLEPSRGTIR